MPPPTLVRLFAPNTIPAAVSVRSVPTFHVCAEPKFTTPLSEKFVVAELMSTPTAPSVKAGQRYFYFDPVDQLPPEGRARWADPGEHQKMLDEAVARL